jgi:DNA-directed RNA polymerase specialized sigma24 family protein
MSVSPNVTQWFRQLQAGDRQAVQKLWENYYRSLVALARKKLGGLPRRAADEEDVALSAFDSFIRGAEQGRFPRLEDRDDLWQVLVLITARKAADLIVHEGRERRDWRRVQGQPEDPDTSGPMMRALIGREPDPAFAAEVADQFERLLALLSDDELRQIALRKLEGYSNEEIAGQINRAPATVDRRLRLIRKRWAGTALS